MRIVLASCRCSTWNELLGGTLWTLTRLVHGGVRALAKFLELQDVVLEPDVSGLVDAHLDIIHGHDGLGAFEPGTRREGKNERFVSNEIKDCALSLWVALMATKNGRAVVEFKFFDHFQTRRRAYVVLQLCIQLRSNVTEIMPVLPCLENKRMEQLAPHDLDPCHSARRTTNV